MSRTTKLERASEVAERAIDQALAAGHREFSRSLALAMAVRDDHVLQAMIRRTGKASVAAPYLLRLGEDPVWMPIGARQGGRLLRAKPPSMAVGELTDLRKADPRLDAMLSAAAAGPDIVGEARTLADGAFRRTDLSAEDWTGLEPWSSMLEGPAYRTGLRLSAAVGELGQALRTARRPPAANLLLYWDGIELLRRMSGFACRVQARNRLSEMAGRFDWSQMSPTWPMLRQRSLGLAASAARAAAAFGPDAAPHYFRRLEASRRNRLARFDALFGLASIALAEPQAAPAILRDMKREASAHSGEGEADFGHAMATLDGGLRARNSTWLLQAHLSRPTNPAPSWRDVVLCDPFLELPDGALAGFAGLTSLAARQALKADPKPRWLRRTALAPEDVRTLVQRTGVAP